MTMISKVELFGGVKASLEGFVCGYAQGGA